MNSHSKGSQTQTLLSICISQDGKEKLVNSLSQTLLQEMQYFSQRLLHFISADTAAINSVRHINK